MKDWAGRKVDKTLDQVSSSDYDPIVLPGGQINPDLLRVEPKALKFIKEIFDAQKIVAAVCRAPVLRCRQTNSATFRPERVKLMAAISSSRLQ